MTTKSKEGKEKKRVYITHKRIAFANRKSQSNVQLLEFRECMESFANEKGYFPTKAEISFEIYNDLLEADYGLDGIKPKKVGELFGVKIYIDPMLKPNDCVFKNENYD